MPKNFLAVKSEREEKSISSPRFPTRRLGTIRKDHACALYFSYFNIFLSSEIEAALKSHLYSLILSSIVPTR